MHDGSQPSGALAELLARDGTLDDLLSGRGLRFERATVVGPPPEPTQPLYFPAPDWEAERLERKEREQLERQQERDQIIQEELAKISNDDQPPETIPRRRGWQRKERP